MGQSGCELFRFFGYYGGSVGVDGGSSFRIRFGLVHSGISGCIDDEIRAQLAQNATNRKRICQIKFLTTERYCLAQMGYEPPAPPPHLAAFTDSSDPGTHPSSSCRRNSR